MVGGAEFANYVMQGPDQHTKKDGELHVFVNGRERAEAEDEARAMRNILKKPITKVYRIMNHLGPNSGGYGADSVSVMAKRVVTSLFM